MRKRSVACARGLTEVNDAPAAVSTLSPNVPPLVAMSAILDRPSLDAGARSDAWLARAGALARIALAGLPPPPWLQGRHIALAGGDAAQAQRLRRAVEELGGRIAVISALTAASLAPTPRAATARALRTLYDAVDCPHLDGSAAAALAQAAGIVVWSGITSERHALASLACELDVEAPRADRWRWLVQSALLDAFQ